VGVKTEVRIAQKIEPGRFAEGPRSPGLSCPPPQCASKKLVTEENFQAWTASGRRTSICLPNFRYAGEKLRSVAAVLLGKS